ncbi:uncharacterized protein LOC116127437 [Pistacia vera]|uniref:uncharacterized protein LOC116127437 n=1 Tax=Pistacia vera TaxID=55513 RepID=UPI0012631FAF|nr:uncharacterized protein LOC116127437 [Pistacia vera]
MASPKVNRVFECVFRSWQWVSNVDRGTRGCRIGIGWNPAIYNVCVLEMTDQAIHCIVRILSVGEDFRYSFIYAANDYIARKELWRNLCHLNKGIASQPWLILGDFNITLNPNENVGGSPSILVGMQDFRACVRTLEMEHISKVGMMYTWNGKPYGNNGVLRKLDRVMGNYHFLSKFPQVNTFFWPSGISDHNPLVTSFPFLGALKPKPFKFFNYLVFKEDFKPLVQRIWSMDSVGVPMFSISKKLKALKPCLQALNRKQVHLNQKVLVLRQEVEQIQRALDVDPHNQELRDCEAVFFGAFREALLDEDRFLKQKSKIQWLSVGDQNTAFFS